MAKEKLKLFGRIGLAIGKVVVPQIATVEAAVGEFRSGKDKQAAVLHTVKASLELSEALSGKDIIDIEKFSEGLRMINDGYVLVMNAVRNDDVGDAK